MTTLEVIQRSVGGCREWVEVEHNCCFRPAEYVLWGKLIPPEGLGPRCYEHAAKYISDPYGLRSGTTYALIHLRDLANAIETREVEATA